MYVSVCGYLQILFQKVVGSILTIKVNNLIKKKTINEQQIKKARFTKKKQIKKDRVNPVLTKRSIVWWDQIVLEWSLEMPHLAVDREFISNC